MTATEPTSIDRTHPGVFCKVHGDSAPAAYLGRERYGCWHCNPTRPVEKHAELPRTYFPEREPIGEIPAWMLGEG